MNVFITDLEFKEAAKNLCDDHIREYPNKILSICKAAIATDNIGPLEEWCRISRQNLEWMLDYGIAICNIFAILHMKNHPDKGDLIKLKEAKRKFPSLGITKRLHNVSAKYAQLGFINANRECYKEKHSHSYYSPCRKRPKWLN